MKMVIPREHGAWGMLMAPLAIGMFASGLRPDHVLLVLGVLAAYMSSYSLIQWIKYPGRSSQARRWTFVYGAAGMAFGLPLLYRYPALLWLVLPAALTLLVNIGFAIRRQERHLLNDLAAMSGLSLGAVAAYFVGRQEFDGTAWIIWLACVLQFFGSALHVKTLIREKGVRSMKSAANLYHGVLLPLPLVANALFPGLFPYGWLSLAYAFSAVKVWATPFNASIRPIKVGLVEVANVVWFVTVASAVFR